MSASESTSSQLHTNVSVRKKSSTKIKGKRVSEHGSVLRSPDHSSSEGETQSNIPIDTPSSHTILQTDAPLNDVDKDTSSIASRLKTIIVSDEGTAEELIQIASQIKEVDSLSQETSKLGTEIPQITCSVPVTMAAEEEWKRLFILQEVKHDDLIDHMTEHVFNESSAVEDIDKSISRIEDLRSKYRGFHKELRTSNNEKYDAEVKEGFEKCLQSIKEYLKTIRSIKTDIRSIASTDQSQVEFLRQRKEEEEKERKLNTAEFLISDVERMIDSLEGEFQSDVTDESEVSNDDLWQFKKDLPEMQKQMDSLSGKYKELLEVIPSTFPNKGARLEKLRKEHQKLIALHVKFASDVSNEAKSRELSKEKQFQISSLDIKLPKFSGYDSQLDVYTFQEKFMKLHKAKVPKSHMPELIKNNYLEGAALDFVRRHENIDEIWTSLKKSFGDPRMMLMKKLKQLESMGPLYRIKDSEKAKNSLSKVINVIEELIKLGKDHHIEEKLYNGDAIYSIYKILGDNRTTRFLEKTCDENLEGEDLWRRLIKFLDREIKINLEKSMIHRSLDKEPKEEKDKDPPKKSHMANSEKQKDQNQGSEKQKKKDQTVCFLCGKSDHVPTKGPYGMKLIQYFTCQKFTSVAPAQRLAELNTKGLCIQCLFPGAKASGGKHVEGKCQNTYVCKHESHQAAAIKKHVLVCEEHKCDEANKTLLEEYRTRCITRACNSDLPEFSKTIQLNFHSTVYSTSLEPSVTNTNITETDNPLLLDDEVKDHGIYMFQNILVNGHKELLFFDGGCGDLVSSWEAVQRLGGNAKQLFKGPIPLGGVGDMKIESPHGIYRIALPLHNGKHATMSGVVLDQVTSEFPEYTLNTDIWSDIKSEYKRQRGNPHELPRLPESVGGKVSFMVGIKNAKYFPEEQFRLPCGLTIYLSPFVSPDGSRGVVGGPHSEVTRINNYFHTQYSSAQATAKFSAYLSNQLQIFCNGYHVNPDLLFLEPKCPKDYSQSLLTEVDVYDHIFNKTNDDDDCTNKTLCPSTSTALVARNKRIFDEVENAGSEISYRCVGCRDCKNCRNGERIELISTKEEVEQAIIEKSVHVDLEANITEALLPFTEDPTKKLASNQKLARKVYDSVIRKLDKDPQSKQEVIAFEKKLQDLNMVDYVSNLSHEQQQLIKNASLQYYFPWLAVWNGNSVSTPCRMVFHGSMPTATNLSINDILAKGRNNMNKLVEIIIRWFSKRFALHTDISKMYNTLKLKDVHWMYQLYLWHDELDPEKDPLIKVIKTLIYGIISSGNQAEYGIRETARLQQELYPRIHEIVHKDVYVDDCITGENTLEEVHQSAEDLELVLAKGGYKLKGVTFVGEPPSPNLSADGKEISVAGFKWDPKDDFIHLDVSELNFARKCRGKKPRSADSNIPDVLTKSHCASKVPEIFDIVGLMTPITAAMKLDLRDLTKLKTLKWNDAIPDNLRGVWISHFEMMKEMGSIRYQRSVVPEDAVSLDIDTIDTADASKTVACVAIYARFLRKCGEYSCQLVFARSKLIEEGTTQPRAELIAALLNSHTGQVVKRAFGDLHKKALKLGDNQVVLHWIHNDRKALKPWTRSRVIEICRFTDRSQWFYVESEKLIADLGTRRGAKLKDVDSNSAWINGYDWMRKPESSFPIISVKDLRLSESDSESFKKEVFAPYDNVEDLITSDWPPSKTYPAYSSITLQQCNACINPNQTYMTQVYNPNQSASYSHAYLSTEVLTTEDRFQVSEIVARYEFSNYILDPMRLRFSTVIRVIAIVIKVVRKWRAKVATRLKSREPASNVQGSPDIVKPVNESSTDPVKDEGSSKVHVLVLTVKEIAAAKEYLFKKATAEVKHFAKESEYKNISTEQNDILYYTGRILPEQNINSAVKMTDVMKDLCSTSFYVPFVDAHSPIAFSVINEIHWDHKVANHSGNETVFRYVMQVCYVINGKKLVKLFRTNCERCRYLAKRTVDIAMGPVDTQNLTIAPAFYITQVDIAGPFSAYTFHNKRKTIKLWFAVYCCSTTSTVNLKVMEDYTSASFIESYIRFSCDVGYPKLLVSDEGSQLVKGYEDMKITYTDLKNKLFKEVNVEFDLCSVGGHNVIGKVERKIKDVKASITKSFQNHRLSVIQWETVGSQVANAINDMPLALGNVSSTVECLDLITPNRLKLGRNNERSPVGPLYVTDDPSKFFTENSDIFNCWFECWLTSYVPNLMNHPKWFKSDYHLKEGDIVLFLKKEGLLNDTYQYGMVEHVEIGRDQKVRTATIKYRNHNEEFDRQTRRSIRQLVVIHRIDELDIIHELGQIATIVDMKKKLCNEQCGCN